MTNRELQFVMSLRDNFTAGWQKAVGNAQASLARMRQQLGQVQGWIAGAFSVAAIVKLEEAFRNAQAATATLNQSLAKVGEASRLPEFEKMATDLQNVTGFSDEAIKKGQELIVSITGSADATRAFTPLVLDLARKMDISVEAAAKMIARTAEGSDALKRLGINIGTTSNETERLSKLQKELERVVGGTAEAFGRTEEGLKRIREQKLDDLYEDFGKLVNDVLTPFRSLLADVVDIMKSAPTPIKAMSFAIIGLTAAFIGLNIPLGGVPIAIGALVTGLIGLVTWIRQDTEHVKRFTDAVQAFVDIFIPARIVVWFFGTALPAAFDIAKKAISSLVDAWNGLSDAINDSPFIKSQVDIASFFLRMYSTLNPIFAGLRAAVKLFAKETADTLAPAISHAKVGTEEWKSALQGVLAALGDTTGTKAAAGSIEAMRQELKKMQEEFDKLPAYSARWNQLAIEIQRAQKELEKVQAAASLVGRDTSVIKIAVEATVSKLKLDENLRLPTNLPTVEIPAVITIDEQLEDAARVAPLLHNQMRRMADQQALIAKYGQEWYNKLIEAERQFEVLSAASMALTDTLRANFNQAWDDIFGEANSLLEQFGRRFLQILMDDVLARFERSLLDRIAGGASGGGGGGGLGIGALAGAIHPALALLGFLFHKGGTVPKAHSGAYVDPNGALKGLSLSNIPSNKEFPIIVRGGETIRTEMQERHLQQMIQQAQSIINSANRPPAGVSLPPSYPTSPAVASPVGTSNTTTNRTEVTINISGPVVGRAEWVIESIQEAVRRSGLPVDRLAVNTRGKRQL